MVFVLILVFVLVIVIVFSGKPLFTQCIAMADAKHCDGGCKALRWQMQSFAGADAKLCVGSCKALRLRQAITGTEIVSLILD